MAIGAAASLFIARESVSVQAEPLPKITEAVLQDLPRTLSKNYAKPSAPFQPTETAYETPIPKPTAIRSQAPQVRSVLGTATWYCLSGTSRCTRGYSGGLYAAISPDLAYLGKHLTICRGNACVDVTVIDCNCEAHHSIDLYSDAFRVIGNLSEGRIKVTISESS